MGRASYGGSTGIVDHPAGWNEETVGGGRRDEAARYSGLGAAAAQRQAYQADFGKAMGNEQQGLQARDQQDAGLRTMRQAAMGNAPSQAAILGNQAAGQGLAAQMQAGAGGRGLGAAAAQMQAAQAAPGQQLGAVGQYAGMRGNEMAHAQAAFGAGANQMRQGDYAQQGMAQQRAEAQARAEMTQRELNQSAQLGYEQMGVRGNQAQSEGELRQKGIASKENNTRDSAHDQEENRFMNYAKGATKTVAGWFGLSDERSKQNVQPLGGGLAGALARIKKMHRDQEQGGADERDVSAIRGMDPDAKQRRDLHRAMEEGGGPTPYSPAPYRQTESSLAEGEGGYVLDPTTGKVRKVSGHGDHVTFDDDGPGAAPQQYAAGPQSAAHGYGASRAGKVGDVTGGGPQASYDLGFGAGPSAQAPTTGVAPGTSDFDRYGGPVDRSVMLSDDKTKLVAAQREAFTAGLAHANEAADTGKLGEAPAYMREKPSTEKHQPSSLARAAMSSEARADRSQQSATNKQTGRDLAVSELAGLPGLPPSLLGGGLIRGHEIADEQQQRANAKRTARPTHVDPTSFVRDNPAPVGDPERTRVQPPATPRRVGNDTYERETPDTRPDYQKLVNQTLFGTPNMEGESASLSDERTKSTKREMKSFTRGDSTVDTALTPAEEARFAEWKKKYAPDDLGTDYDLRGAYKQGLTPDASTGHWPDTYKKPNHETFSDESQYAKQGAPGHWVDNTFIPPVTGTPSTNSNPETRAKFVDWQGLANSALDSFSDERSKQGAHAEKDMGAALAEGFKPFEYEYKPEFAGHEGQQQGEKNVGPMAQNMASNSITGSAVEKGPDGLLRISIPKTVKTNSAGIGYLAARMQKQDAEIAKLKGGR